MAIGRPVVVTTAHRGVFFGYAEDTSGKVVDLKACRNCLSWTSEVRGFLGLAAKGPTAGCRVGPSVDVTLHDVTCVAECTPDAVAAWESEPWG